MTAESPQRSPSADPLTVGLVIAIYRGEETLRPLIEECVPLAAPQRTPEGRLFRITEVILVHDCGPDQSARVMQALAAEHPFVRTVWLSRNFGQHPALIAGMAESESDWIVTMDEDGQHNPADIPAMLDLALSGGCPLVYARPTNRPPHSLVRNIASSSAKWIARTLLSSHNLRWFHSFRLIRGDIARALPRLCSTHVYIDVALSWLVDRSRHCPVAMRRERRISSGYNYSRLLAHFWRMVLATGTRPLRFVGLLGAGSILLAFYMVGYALWSKWVWHVQVPGWTSLMIVLSAFSGVILFSQAIMAEYLGIAITMAMGKPLYFRVPPSSRQDPQAATAPVPEPVLYSRPGASAPDWPSSRP